MKVQNVSQILSEAELIIANIARNEQIQKSLANYGFPSKRIKEGEHLLKVAVQLKTMMEDQQEARYETSQAWLTDFQNAKATYQGYVNLARTVYRNQPVILRKLKIDRPTPKQQQPWIEQALHFYSKVSAYKEAIEQRYGLSSEVWTQAMSEVESLSDSRSERLHLRAQAQQATEQRNYSLIKLHAWVKELKYIAKVALKDDPQLLEALGIVVPSR
ncbi:hypothetical protein [Tunicatimonas pelagia]|uniref:hypothetical protein n=1 Tax=Tunicatimonas pelagia TaxID=931531 RepID=UPI00266634B8|nr:hypothetical protein [Tunicatimonas pelagia]WKN44482.1 hypothetical protein P0M28_05830 [Tunicatimonas pelagia]